MRETMYTLAACAEMLYRDRPIQERARRIHELGFQVEIWDWSRHDLAALARTGAVFSSMTGYIRGSLTDEDGAAELLRTARESVSAAQRLGCPRLNLHGTGLDEAGLPVRPVTGEPNGPMWIAACRTLTRLAELGENAGLTFTLEAWAAEDSVLALERFRSAFTPVTLSTATHGGFS